MSSMWSYLPTAVQLGQWAESTEARGDFPLFVYKLLRATNRDASIEMHFGDGANRPGLDGVVTFAEEKWHVPAGRSVWELGVGGDPGDKANADYKKRSEGHSPFVRADTTFIFVTPRLWPRKDDWLARKRADNIWRDVLAFDASELIRWLEDCPSVLPWVRERVRGIPGDVRDMELAWSELSSGTTPSLPPVVLLAGRGDALKRVRQWLAGPASHLRIRADSTEDAIAFVAAVLHTPVGIAEAAQRRAVLIVSTQDGWRWASGQSGASVLILPRSYGGEEAAVASGKHVLTIRAHRPAPSHRPEGEVPDLKHLGCDELEAALKTMGLTPDRACAVARESRGRYFALLDLLGAGEPPPLWATPTEAVSLVPFLLAGAWRATGPDAAVVARLGRMQPQEYETRLKRWNNEPDSPVRLVDGTWEWIALERGWKYLPGYLFDSDFEVFREVFRDVFGISARYSAADRPDAYLCCTDLLREALAETLVFFSIVSKDGFSGFPGKGLASCLVRELFAEGSNFDVWRSNAPYLMKLAEAAPDEFLGIVERDLVGNDALCKALLCDDRQAQSTCTALMWALEVVAWFPKNLGRVAVVLGKLAAMDPTDRRSNRPLETLKSILVPWAQDRTSTSDRRLCALDAIRRRNPEVAFKLCLKLMGGNPESYVKPQEPRRRMRGKPGQPIGDVSNVMDIYRTLFRKSLDWAGQDGRLWAELLSPLRADDREQLEELVARLESMPWDRSATDGNDALRRALRWLLHRKRTIEGCYRFISPEYCDRLMKVYERLEPTDPILRDAWLFDSDPDLLTVTGGDGQSHLKQVEIDRSKAIRDFVAMEPPVRLLEFADRVARPDALGAHIGCSPLTDNSFLDVADMALDSATGNRLQCAMGMIGGRYHSEGMQWVDRLFSVGRPRDWSPERKAAFARGLPFETAVWDWIENWGEAAADAYWRIGLEFVSDPQRDGPRAVRTLLNRKRPFAALRTAAYCANAVSGRQPLPPDTELEILIAITTAVSEGISSPEDSNVGCGSGYEITVLIERIEAAGIVSEDELADIELTWFPVLKQFEPGPAALYRRLAIDPLRFARYVGWTDLPRRPNHADSAVPEAYAMATARAAQIKELLRDWPGVPGTATDGTFDGEFFKDWVERARQELAETGHSEVGDRHLGEVLARAPQGSDGVWPHESVREFLERSNSRNIERGIVDRWKYPPGCGFLPIDQDGTSIRAKAKRFGAWASALTEYPAIVKILCELELEFEWEAEHADDWRAGDEFR